MKLTILGCGTSTGVPRLGNDWGDCDPENPKNRRTRASILVEAEGFRILIDTGPDMREQLLRAEIADIDAVIWTHDHADHCHGIDDLRQIYFQRRKLVAAYGSAKTLAALNSRFGYVFTSNKGYPATAEAHELMADMTIGPFRVRTAEQPHGPGTSTGIKLGHAGLSLAYAIDFGEITEDMRALYQDADLLVTDCLRHDPHPTHAHLGMTMALIEQTSPKAALLSHMDKSMDYANLCCILPPHIRPAYDGLEVTLG